MAIHSVVEKRRAALHREGERDVSSLRQRFTLQWHMHCNGHAPQCDQR
jgi:hypothetical protein